MGKGKKRKREDGEERDLKRPRVLGPDRFEVARYLLNLATELRVPVNEIPDVDERREMLDEHFGQPGVMDPNEDTEGDVDPNRLMGLDPMTLRSQELTSDEDMEGPDDANVPNEPWIDADTLAALNTQSQQLRGLRRASIPIEKRKPTFYTYMQAPGGIGWGSLFTSTPYTDKVRELEPDAENTGSEFSLSPDISLPEKPQTRANLNKDHVTTAKQGPHSLAHVLIEEMLNQNLPGEAMQTEDTSARWRSRVERWNKLEEMYVSQVDPPEKFAEAVQGEELSDEKQTRVMFALHRHQELFNQLEVLINGHYVRRMAATMVDESQMAKWLETALETDAEEFEQAHNVLGELVELAPFGSYAWHGGGATHAQLGGKGERRDPYLGALDKLRNAHGRAERQKALEQLAKELATLFDYEQGQFVDMDGYRAFLLTRFELAGTPEEADQLLAMVLKIKDPNAST